ncbi:MAG: energy transducer TonB [Candidatus Omnitrophota bacterium]
MSYHFAPKIEEASSAVHDQSTKASLLASDPLVKVGGEAGAKKNNGPMPLFKDAFDVAADLKVFERAPEKVKGLKVTKEVSIPILKSEKIDTPGYAMYTNIIRDRIRERAYVNFVKYAGGDVYLTFVVKSDGQLSDVQVLQNRSQASEALCAAGLDSIREAAPFPAFPKELNYPELTFNIQISFQLHQEE